MVRLKGLPKLSDANNAGTKKALDCTLILTEGDSAKSLAVAGRPASFALKWRMRTRNTGKLNFLIYIARLPFRTGARYKVSYLSDTSYMSDNSYFPDIL